MLIELRLKDFGLADSLSLAPGAGLVAVTGETGAGKSLLVNALAFATGERAQAEWVRSGAEHCEVTAVFEPRDVKPFAEWLDGTEATLCLRRDLATGGRGRAWINDRPVPVSSLKRAGLLLCDLHSQHQHQSLLHPEHHAEYLDGFVKPELVLQYREAYQHWAQCESALQAHRKRLVADLQQKDFWEFQRGELDRINPRPGEYEELEALRTRLRSAGDAGQLLQMLAAELDGSDDSLVPRLARLAEKLEASPGPATGQKTGEWAALLRQAKLLLEEVGSALSETVSSEPESDSSLEEVEQRLHALYNLKKKFGGSLETAVAERDRISENLQFLAQGEAEVQKLSKAAKQALTSLSAAGASLAGARSEAAGKMRKELGVPLSELGLGKDPLSVEQTPLEPEAWTEAGPSRIEFLLQANPGEAPKPLAKIASGGELSRIMLGLKSVLPGNRGVQTLVFDEIDAGIGGETAVLVGKRLELLARGRQVIVITHLHQIASQATSHVEVRKRERDGRHVPEVKILNAAERQAALARLIAGDRAPAAARAAALAILKAGRRD